MDLGLDFEDSDFVKEEKPRPLLTSYNAKICSPEWFLSEKADNEHNDKATLYKFRGDYYYRLMDYSQAIQCYTISLSNLGSQNRTMRREVTESLARCHLNLGHTEHALELSDQVLDDCLTKDQTIQGLSLKQHIYQSAGLIRDEINILYRLIHVHPRNVQFWSSVKQVFETISRAQSEQRTGLYRIPQHLVKDKQRKNEHSETVATSHLLEIKTIDMEDINDKSTYRRDIDDTGRKDVNSTILSKDSSIYIGTDIDVIEQNLAHLDTGSHYISTETFHMNSKQIPCSTRNGNTIQEQQYNDILTGISCDHLVLTCCVRIRLILQSVQGTVGSFIKEKNLELQRQIDRQISSLDMSDDILQKVTEFMKKDMFEDDYGENNSSENEDREIPTLTPAEFNRRWFSWMQET